MMTEIALNVLDVAENSVRADASYIEIDIAADTKKDVLEIIVRDNGCGMSKEQVKRVTDPFYTTRTTRKVGLGIPFFKQAAESTGGSFKIESRENEGTCVKAVFGLSHIDRMPLGDINSTIYTLVVFNEAIDFHYRYSYDGREFVFDTKQMKQILGDLSFQNAEVSQFIRDYLDTNKAEVDGGQTL
ncbi:ATP-binding protein [Bariatricus sp. SGI.154]|uniref:ATP-binding protein n=1 Tax=Bariatricus sp. SGI.154 TaxID=3420549 RepID=UPI003CFD85F8